jgi:tetratricopeptide (TPR) repeat protein
VLFLRELAQRVLHHNCWQEALDILGKALTLDPDSIPTLLELSNIHWEVYHLSEAEAICQRILALDPGNRDVVYMMSALPGRKGDAKAHFRT